MFDLVDGIKNSKLFNNVTVDEIRDIIAKTTYKEVTYTKGESVFSTYLNAQYVGIIVCGKIHIEKLLPSGKSVLMYEKKSGDILGEVAAFSDTEFYPCDAVSITHGKILIFKKMNFFELIYSNKEVTKNFLNLVCNKAYSLNNHIGSLSYTSAKQKVAESLLSYSNQNDSDMIKLPYSRKTWADRLNISRASLYRELESLCSDSVISLEKKSFIK
ncbi:MAG: Crp/Fnr family transcriptional regulator, partial [Clostridium sp.]|nr:Crp/Fnr family transcriptional regulator [Clostridium sp.]